MNKEEFFKIVNAKKSAISTLRQHVSEWVDDLLKRILEGKLYENESFDGEAIEFAFYLYNKYLEEYIEELRSRGFNVEVNGGDPSCYDSGKRSSTLVRVT